MMRSLHIRILLCLAAVAALGTLGCRTSPVTGEREFILVGEQEELALGNQTHPNVVFMYDGEYHDADLNRYLGTIVMRLHACSHRPHLQMEFTMLNTSIINAFATPGHVYATRGFLARLENEAQFAAVMGHELAHVAAGHTAKQLSREALLSLSFGIVDYAAGDAGWGSAVLTAGEVGVTVLGLSYSREQERQADRVGTYYMAVAGWDPAQAVRMQELLASFDEHEPTLMDEYLSTHPTKDDRIVEIRTMINAKDISSRYVQGDGVYAERWERRLGRLHRADRAFAPYDRGMKLLEGKNFDGALGAAQEAISQQGDQAAFHRLKGDALLGLKRIGEAKAAYRRSLELDGKYALATIGLGRAYLAEGDHAAAQREFDRAARAFPGSLTAQYGLATAHYDQEHYRAAIEPFRRVIQAAPDEPQPLYALAACYDRTDQPGAARVTYRQALDAGLSGFERTRAEERLQALERLMPREAGPSPRERFYRGGP